MLNKKVTKFSVMQILELEVYFHNNIVEQYKVERKRNNNNNNNKKEKEK
jgi:hypothetical protein